MQRAERAGVVGGSGEGSSAIFQQGSAQRAKPAGRQQTAKIISMSAGYTINVASLMITTQLKTVIIGAH